MRIEYGYESLSLTLQKNADELILKVRSLAIEIDSVANQYNCYVENGVIDEDIIELTPPGKLTAIISFVTRRYCVLNNENEDIRTLIVLFLGSQSMLTFVAPCKDSYFRNYYELLQKQIKVKYKDYQDYQRPRIDYLLVKGYLTNCEDGVLRCQKMQEIEVLKHLYEYRACSYWGYPKKERAILEKLVSKEWIEFDAHLLSPAQRDCFRLFEQREVYEWSCLLQQLCAWHYNFLF